MPLDSESVDANFQNFVSAVAEREAVYYLSHPDGVANSVSNDDENVVVLMFWSDKAYASESNRGFDDEYEVAEMDLFEFMYQWLPGMSGDGVLAGPEWTADLIGIEINPFELRELIDGAMSADQRNACETRFNELAEGS